MYLKGHIYKLVYGPPYTKCHQLDNPIKEVIKLQNKNIYVDVEKLAIHEKEAFYYNGWAR